MEEKTIPVTMEAVIAVLERLISNLNEGTAILDNREPLEIHGQYDGRLVETRLTLKYYEALR